MLRAWNRKRERDVVQRLWLDALDHAAPLVPGLDRAAYVAEMYRCVDAVLDNRKTSVLVLVDTAMVLQQAATLGEPFLYALLGPATLDALEVVLDLGINRTAQDGLPGLTFDPFPLLRAGAGHDPVDTRHKRRRAARTFRT